MIYMNTQRFVFALLLAVLWLSCGDKKSQNTTTPDPTAADTPQISDEMAIARQTIEGKLIAYYDDLSRGKMDDTQYFAPTVDQFFGSSQVDRSTVGNSIRSGFANLKDREIYLDGTTMAIRSEGTGYVAEFSGQQSYTRVSDQQKVEEKFSNRVTFNSDFQITRYESLGAQASSSRQAPPQQTAMGAVEGLSKALGAGNVEAAQAFIHPEMGFYYLTHPGAMDDLTWCRSITDMTDYPLTPYMKERLLNLRCSPLEEDLPSFDCETFSKQGCFLSPLSEEYERLSSLMIALNEAVLGEYDDADISRARKIEQAVTTQLLDTTVPVAFYFGEVDGKWYLLVVDIASYDCSA